MRPAAFVSLPTLTLALLLAAACGSPDERALASKPTAPGADARGGEGEFGACAAEITTAQRGEVDIVVIIDTSGSMDAETAQVQANINKFAQTIGQSGLDYRVVLIAEKFKPSLLPAGVPILGAPSGICVPPPLGGANCGDNAPLFRHLTTTVGSDDSLDILLNTYDATWHAWVRPTSTKVFIEITDDNSVVDWKTFDQKLLQKAGAVFGTAAQRKYIFNAICGWQDGTTPLSSTRCATAQNNGDQYQHLSQLTKGTIESVCKADYGSVFNNIASGLVASLGCEFAVPKTTGAAGASVDPTKVAVRYTKAGQAEATLVQVTDASKCAGVSDAWYYDDNQKPTRILFCPALCQSVGKDLDSKVEVAVGCKAPAPR